MFASKHEFFNYYNVNYLFSSQNILFQMLVIGMQEMIYYSINSYGAETFIGIKQTPALTQIHNSNV